MNNIIKKFKLKLILSSTTALLFLYSTAAHMDLLFHINKFKKIGDTIHYEKPNTDVYHATLYLFPMLNITLYLATIHKLKEIYHDEDHKVFDFFAPGASLKGACLALFACLAMFMINFSTTLFMMLMTIRLEHCDKLVSSKGICYYPAKAPLYHLFSTNAPDTVISITLDFIILIWSFLSIMAFCRYISKACTSSTDSTPRERLPFRNGHAGYGGVATSDELTEQTDQTDYSETSV